MFATYNAEAVFKEFSWSSKILFSIDGFQSYIENIFMVAFSYNISLLKASKQHVALPEKFFPFVRCKILIRIFMMFKENWTCDLVLVSGRSRKNEIIQSRFKRNYIQWLNKFSFIEVFNKNRWETAKLWLFA